VGILWGVRRFFAISTAVLAAAGSAGAAPASAPALRLIDTSPLTVRGLGFHESEHVRVTAILYARGRYMRTVTTGSRGGFVVRFGGVEPGPCEGYRIVALGDEGSRVTLWMPPPACGGVP